MQYEDPRDEAKWQPFQDNKQGRSLRAYCGCELGVTHLCKTTLIVGLRSIFLGKGAPVSTNENMAGSEEKNPSTKTNATRLSNAVYRHGILV
eukprot:scaffold1582_cov318-Pavlova_lutheri.AAC.6